MARPKLGDGDTLRLHMKISEAEAAVIDDWRFANRIESRSEAIRRLVQIGLRADARVTDILEQSRLALVDGVQLRARMQVALGEQPEPEKRVVTLIAERYDQLLMNILKTHTGAGKLLSEVLDFHQTATAVEELEKAVAASDDYKQAVYDRIDRDWDQ